MNNERGGKKHGWIAFGFLFSQLFFLIVIIIMNLNHFISKKRGHLGFGNYSEKNRMKRIPEDLNTLMK